LLKAMNDRPMVYILCVMGRSQDAQALVKHRYGKCEVAWLSWRELRESGFKGQIRKLRALKGQALVFFFESVDNANPLLLYAWTCVLHRCRETIIADAAGRLSIYRPGSWLHLLPITLWSALRDLGILLGTSFFLRLRSIAPRNHAFSPRAMDRNLDLAYLFLSTKSRATPGGATSHILGFLGGVAAESGRCEVFAGHPIPGAPLPIHEIPPGHRPHLIREAVSLAYNFRFARRVRTLLEQNRPRALYQRHGRFMFAGALLAARTGIPLILEYNGSEVWIADHWDPSHFRSLLRRCEVLSLSAASLIVVVSEPLREELQRAGVPSERILVNPNGVDPDRFRPGCGGKEIRDRLGFQSEDLVVGFVGTFSYWHGIQVLQQGITNLLGQGASGDKLPHLKFLLVGDGLLRAEMSDALRKHQESGSVVFTGTLSHELMPQHLDAADILVSPHVPMPDGREFFGSPTKLFEYMAMGKAIVASNLGQLGRVLEHDVTALLVRPGDAGELASAIANLASDAGLRKRLGLAARAAALERHTWKQNAARVLAYLSPSSGAGEFAAYPRSAPLKTRS
jgi:glycosyltransferase involved in cell wall biosynthesis